MLIYVIYDERLALSALVKLLSEVAPTAEKERSCSSMKHKDKIFVNTMISGLLIVLGVNLAAVVGRK